jgi:pilus assembly protein CpaB
MRASNVLITLAAVVMGAIAALLAVNWLRSQSQLASREPTQNVVVATGQLGVGTALSESNTAEIPWAAGAPLPDGAFTSRIDMLKGGKRLVLTAIERNEPVLRAKVTEPGQSGSLSSQLDADKRAVTVSVDDVRGVAGLIRPGDRVDVVLIRSLSGVNTQAYSDIILQNVKVLALDQSTSDVTGKPKVAKAVTLEVTPEEAQKVLLSASIGRLSLVLRQSGNAAVEASKRVSERDLVLSDTDADKKAVPVTAPAAAVSVAPAAVRMSQEMTTVAIVRGMKRE